MANIEMNAIVTRKFEVAPGLIIMHVAPTGWELPEFIPGQFTVLGLPGDAPRYSYSEAEINALEPGKMIKRAYSIASGSIENEYLEFYVGLVRSGALTPRLFALNPGDKLWLSPKMTGMFTMDKVPEDKNIILIATGTGVAPYMSMLRSIVLTNESRKFAAVHGAYNSKDLGYRSELETIERLASNFTYIPVISEPDKEPVAWNGKTGFVQRVWEDRDLQEKWGTEITPENTRIFLCGHPNMISGMMDILETDGFSEHTKKNPGTVHLERY